MALLSRTIFWMVSELSNRSALSAACKCIDCAVFVSRLISFGPNSPNLPETTDQLPSRSSSISLRNTTSFAGFVMGQTFSSDFISGTLSWLSLSIKCLIQSCSYVLKVERVLTLWRGTITLLKNSWFSGFKGAVNPEIILERISRSSVSPLWVSYS